MIGFYNKRRGIRRYYNTKSCLYEVGTSLTVKAKSEIV